ncbi:MAG: hypothetical protein J6S85_13675 [Methanobrevibacter sp.]|nr:hypothetical protein [Methanobrevibacter sp.]
MKNNYTFTDDAGRWYGFENGKHGFEILKIKAISKYDESEAIQDALLIHEDGDEFRDGDCVLFGYSAEDFETADDIAAAVQNECASTCYYINANGIFIVD